MDKKKDCLACSGDCEIISNLKKHKNWLPYFAWITYILVLFIVACFCWQTFYPQDKAIAKSITISVIDSQEKGIKLSTELKADLKEQLYIALMEVSARAEAAYNEKFATLLTILTIFGIAWPIVVSYLQSMGLERDRNEIIKAGKKTEEIYQKNLYQEKEIIRLQAYFYMRMGCVYLLLAENSELFINKKSTFPIEGTEVKAPIKEDKTKVTQTFKILIDSLENFFLAEKTDPSYFNSEKTSLGYIGTVSFLISNLVYNYENIDYSSVIFDLDKVISEIEQLDNNLSVVKESLDLLSKAKVRLEDYHQQQFNESQQS